MNTPIIFPHVELNGVKYPRVTLYWYDIMSDSSWVDKSGFGNFECVEAVTEGFVFDIFEKDGVKFLRTFSSYVDGKEGPTFGNKGCFPLSVLKPKCQHIIEMAEVYIQQRA
jgi:hypothetical protein